MKYKIYVDGSFINNKIGFGALVLDGDKIIKELSGKVDGKYLEHRQVAGELYAVINTLKWCDQNNINDIIIYYDYQGIADWATGRWKAKKELTRNYIKFISQCKINIQWKKVAAHSGDKWNDYVDNLAKNGAGYSLNKSIKKNQLCENQLVDELKKIALEFTEFLLNNGLNAVYSRVMNNMFARIEIYNAEGRCGIFDLYNTIKKRLSPDIRAFKDKNVEKKILQLWEKFK